MPCIAFLGGPADHGGPTPITKADLALALSHVGKARSTQFVTALCFPWSLPIQRRRRKKCGLKFLMAATVRIFAILHVVGILLRHWELVPGVPLNTEWQMT